MPNEFDFADPVMTPRLTESQWTRLVAHAESLAVADGEHVFRAGQREYPMVLVEEGRIELVRDALAWMGEEVVTTMGPRTSSVPSRPPAGCPRSTRMPTASSAPAPT